MPKMKTHSGAKKRFRVTGSGHVKFKRAGMRHIQAKMTTKRKRNLRKGALVKKVELLSFDHLLIVLVKDLVTKSGNGILITFDEHDGGSEVSVCKSTEDPAGPIEVIGINGLCGCTDIGRHLGDVGV